MYDSELLKSAISDYMYHCQKNNYRPTKKGLANWLSCSAGTIDNYVHGKFNGLPYSIHPHINRLVANKDFPLIRSVFQTDEEEGD